MRQTETGSDRRRLRLSQSWRRMIAVARKELRQLVRDPLTLGFIIGVPAVQLLLFGYAIEQDVRQVPATVVDQANTSVSRWLLGQLEATQTLSIVRREVDEPEARRLLADGTVQVVIVVPADFSRAYYRGRGAELSLLIDATDPTVARAVRAAADGLVDWHDRRLQPAPVTEGLAGTRRPVEERVSLMARPELVRGRFLRLVSLNLFNPELRTTIFVVPALLGVILTTTMILMTALAIVRERERGTFEFLIATPVQRSEVLGGKVLPYIGVGFLQVAIVLVAGVSLFRVPIRGSLLDLTIASLAFIAANLTLGLVISAKASTQFQATQVSFFFFLPSVLLSGFMFPFEAMPEPAQWLGELLPLTHFIRLCRGILLRGASLSSQLPEFLAMVAFAAAGFLIAARLFKKSLA